MRHILVEELYKDRNCTPQTFGSSSTLPNGADWDWPLTYGKNKMVHQEGDRFLIPYERYSLLEYDRNTEEFTLVIDDGGYIIQYAVPTKNNYIVVFLTDGTLKVWDRCSGSYVPAFDKTFYSGANWTQGAPCSYHKMKDKVYIIDTVNKVYKSLSLKNLHLNNFTPLPGNTYLNIGFREQINGVEINGCSYFLDSYGHIIKWKTDLSFEVSEFSIAGPYDKQVPTNLCLYNGFLWFSNTSDYYGEFMQTNSFTTKYDPASQETERYDNNRAQFENHAFVIGTNIMSIGNSYNANGFIKETLGSKLSFMEPIFSGSYFNKQQYSGSRVIGLPESYGNTNNILVGSKLYYMAQGKLNSSGDRKKWLMRFDLESLESEKLSLVGIPLERPVFPGFAKFVLSYSSSQNSIYIYIMEFDSNVSTTGTISEIVYDITADSFSSNGVVGSSKYSVSSAIITDDDGWLVAPPQEGEVTDSDYYYKDSPLGSWSTATKDPFGSIYSGKGYSQNVHYLGSTPQNRGVNHFRGSDQSIQEGSNLEFAGYRINYADFSKTYRSNTRHFVKSDIIYYTSGNSSISDSSIGNSSRDLSYLFAYDTTTNQFVGAKSLEGFSTQSAITGVSGIFNDSRTPSGEGTFDVNPVQVVYQDNLGNDKFISSSFSGIVKVQEITDYIPSTVTNLPKLLSDSSEAEYLLYSGVSSSGRKHANIDGNLYIMDNESNVWLFDKNTKNWSLVNVPKGNFYHGLEGTTLVSSIVEMWPSEYEGGFRLVDKTDFSQSLNYYNNTPFYDGKSNYALVSEDGTKSYYTTPEVSKDIFSTVGDPTISTSENISHYFSVQKGDKVYFLSVYSMGVINSVDNRGEVGWKILEFNLGNPSSGLVQLGSNLEYQTVPYIHSIVIHENSIFITSDLDHVVRVFNLDTNTWSRKVLPLFPINKRNAEPYEYRPYNTTSLNWSTSTFPQFASTVFEDSGGLSLLFFDSRKSGTFSGITTVWEDYEDFDYNNGANQEDLNPFIKTEIRDVGDFSFDYLNANLLFSGSTNGIFFNTLDRLYVAMTYAGRGGSYSRVPFFIGSFDTISEKWSVETSSIRDIQMYFRSHNYHLFMLDFDFSSPNPNHNFRVEQTINSSHQVIEYQNLIDETGPPPLTVGTSFTSFYSQIRHSKVDKYGNRWSLVMDTDSNSYYSNAFMVFKSDYDFSNFSQVYLNFESGYNYPLYMELDHDNTDIYYCFSIVPFDKRLYFYRLNVATEDITSIDDVILPKINGPTYVHRFSIGVSYYNYKLYILYVIAGTFMVKVYNLLTLSFEPDMFFSDSSLMDHMKHTSLTSLEAPFKVYEKNGVLKAAGVVCNSRSYQGKKTYITELV